MYTRNRNKGIKTPVADRGPGFTRAFNGTSVPFASGGLSAYSWVTVGKEAYVTTRDTEVINFHSRRASGETFFNPFETIRESRIMRDVPCTARRREGLYSGESDAAWQVQSRPDTLLSFSSAMGRELLLPNNAVFGPDHAAISEVRQANTAMYDAAINAALSEVAKTDALLMVSAAEFSKTVAMIGKYVYALNSRFAGLRDLALNFWRNPKGMSREAGLALAGEYLALRYGVTPLVYEIQGVVNALLGNSKPSRVTARGASKWDGGKMRHVTIAAAGLRPAMSLHSNTVVHGTVRAGCLYEPILDSVTTRLGLHPSALPEVLFELTKLSFVANWFFDLAETLRAFNATLHGRIIGGWVTEEITSETIHSAVLGGPYEANVFVNGVSQKTTWTWDSQPQSATAHAFYTSRTRTPVTDWSVRTPSLRVQLNALRVADAVALLASTFAGISASNSRTLRI